MSGSCRIQILDDDTVNKMAAGEVVENPASVVKELIENALDAAATSIAVEIKGGGRTLIRISDNGLGMNRDEATLCLKRHATSKIRSIEDLATVGTMGFRGEAIPSIASISRFMVLTANRAGEGTMVLVDGGREESVQAAPRDVGTTIEVKDLFFNVPVRKKFQRSPAFDVQEIVKVVTNEALAHPGVAFELISDRKTLLQAERAMGDSFREQLQERAEALLGREFAGGLRPLEYACEGFTFSGLIGEPSFTRQNRTGQYLFVNGRAIVSQALAFAVKEAYATSIAPTRHPVWILHVTVDPSFVDVNVHPQKREVRFRDGQSVRSAAVAAVRQSLSCKTAVMALSGSSEYVVVREASLPFSFNYSRVNFEDAVPFDGQVADVPTAKQMDWVEERKPSPRVVGLVSKYLIVDPKSLTPPQEGICLVDIRRARSRIIFERLQKRGDKSVQETLLLPLPLSFSRSDAELVRHHIAELQEMGFDIHESGPDAFMVHAMPSVMRGADLQVVLQDLVHDLRTHGDKGAIGREMARQMAASAMRTAFGATSGLNVPEGDLLLRELMACDEPYRSAHGEPTLVQYSEEEIEARFQRV